MSYRYMFSTTRSLTLHVFVIDLCISNLGDPAGSGFPGMMSCDLKIVVTRCRRYTEQERLCRWVTLIFDFGSDSRELVVLPFMFVITRKPLHQRARGIESKEKEAQAYAIAIMSVLERARAQSQSTPQPLEDPKSFTEDAAQPASVSIAKCRLEISTMSLKAQAIRSEPSQKSQHDVSEIVD